MSSIVVNIQDKELSAPFKWKTRTNDLLRVDQMETRHLFFTLRLIWNHTMPPEARLPEGNRYQLGYFYTAEYLESAIKAISHELSGRTDMAPDWSRQLAQMISLLSTPQLQHKGLNK